MGFEFKRGKHVGHPFGLICEKGRSWHVMFPGIHDDVRKYWLNFTSYVLRQSVILDVRRKT